MDKTGRFCFRLFHQHPHAAGVTGNNPGTEFNDSIPTGGIAIHHPDRQSATGLHSVEWNGYIKINPLPGTFQDLDPVRGIDGGFHAVASIPPVGVETVGNCREAVFTVGISIAERDDQHVAAGTDIPLLTGLNGRPVMDPRRQPQLLSGTEKLVVHLETVILDRPVQLSEIDRTGERFRQERNHYALGGELSPPI